MFVWSDGELTMAKKDYTGCQSVLVGHDDSMLMVNPYSVLAADFATAMSG